MSLIRYQQLIEEIQAGLSAPEFTPVDQVRATAVAYAEAVTLANNRLRQCGQLLRKGLRGEAIEICEQEPNLLELVAILDFPEFQFWCEQLQQLKIPLPPKLLVEVAGDLNEAYAEQLPLEQLLKKHRLLALARTPLAARIQVLRQISRLDPHNPTWQDDLRTWETTRQRQMSGEAQQAANRSEYETLAGLKAEVIDPGWLQLPAPDLVERIGQLHRGVEIRHARQALDKLVDELTMAYSAFDLDRARRARNRWERYVQICKLPASDPLALNAEPALVWIAEEDEREAEEARFDHAVAEVESALDNQAPRLELERVWGELERFEREIPAVLENRVASRFDGLDVAARRKHMVVLLSVFTALVLVGLGITYVVLDQAHKKKVDNVVGALQGLVKKEHFPEAEKVLAELDETEPEVARDARVLEQKAAMKAAVRKKAQRKKDFQDALVAAKAPGLLNIDGEALERAKKLAETEEEQTAIAVLEAEVDAAKTVEQNRIDDEFLAKVAPLRKQIGELDQAGLTNEELKRRIDRLVVDVESLLKQAAGVTSHVTEQARQLQTGLSVREKDVRESLLLASSLQAITQSLGQTDRFTKALNDFATKYPTSGLSADFKQAIEEQRFWPASAEWGALLTAQRCERACENPDAAQELLDKAKELREKFGPGLEPPGFAAKIPYLERAKVRGDESVKSRITDLKRLLESLGSDNFLLHVSTFNTKLGKRYYYTTESPKFKLAGVDKPIILKCVVSPSGQERGIRVVPGEYQDTETPPHREVAVKTLKELNRLGEKWDAASYLMFKTTYEAKDVKMEPAVIVHILKQVMEIASAGSLPLAEAFKGPLGQIQEAELSVKFPANWRDPDDVIGQRARTAAEALLKRLKVPKREEFKVLVDRQQVVKEPLRTTHQWVGWLVKDPTRGWQCLRLGAEGISGELRVVQFATDTQQAKYVTIGRVQQGSIRLNEIGKSPLAFLSGRPVFLVGPAPAVVANQ